MVAPTRTPQARGVKCDLCKRILISATWLDQTKLAKKAEEAKSVLSMIAEHAELGCPCIPKNIENLLVGSTHFEIHRLMIKDLDALVLSNQCDIFHKTRHVVVPNDVEAQSNINDCYDNKMESRFKSYVNCIEAKQPEETRQQLLHLISAINFWTIAMEDQSNPFNTKLALRLGLTHHVVYACYLFKFYKMLDHQLKTSILLLNIFKSVEGVTANAMLHAYYLIIRSFIDCSQIDLACQYLKKAVKMSNYQDKSHYESILLNCVDCELRLLDESEPNDKFNILDELAEMVNMKKDDKLQHYYARTLAMSNIIKYIQYFNLRSENCFEYFHTFRFLCAIIRRCYETSFELVLSEKTTSQQRKNSGPSSTSTVKDQMLDHNWIRFAVCDFSFSTFDILSRFYMRSGMPECLELLFNGLSLISYRSGSVYWQIRMMCIGIELDILTGKMCQAEEKSRAIALVCNRTNDSILSNLLRLECEVSWSLLSKSRNTVVKKDVIIEMLNRMRACQQLISTRVGKVYNHGFKSNSIDESFVDLSSQLSESFLVWTNPILLRLGLTLIRAGIASLLEVDVASPDARYLMKKISEQITLTKNSVIEYSNSQILLESLILFAEIADSENQLLNAIAASRLFIGVTKSGESLESQISNISLREGIETDKHCSKLSKGRRLKQKNKVDPSKVTKIAWTGKISRRDIYEVAFKSEENLCFEEPSSRCYDLFEILKRFPMLSKEEILLTYLRLSGPNPDYLLYRRTHEMLLAGRLIEKEISNTRLILYHFTESNSSNTMRYRWMMFEEQRSCPYDRTTSRSTEGESTQARLKHLGFCDSMIHPEKIIKSMMSRMPDDFRLCQFKYIHDSSSDSEHLIVMCFDHSSDLVCIHVERALTSDDFFTDAKIHDRSSLTLPERLDTKIEESRQSLLCNNRMRSETRRKLETDLAIILHDFESELLGPYRFVLCARVTEPKYSEMINDLTTEINRIMSTESRVCRQICTLKMLLDGACLLTRDEFCTVMATLYDCSSTSKITKICYNNWLKMIEQYIKEHCPDTNKILLMKKLPKGQLGLILDDKLRNVPLESLPSVRMMNQGICRLPSLRIYNNMVNCRCPPIKIDPKQVVYILDPASNLSKTRERFDQKLKANPFWSGVISKPPTPEQLETWLSEKDLYIFIGHGAGTVYYNKLCKSRGLTAMAHINSGAVVMGCSSGRLVSEGPMLESFGIGWAFILRGSPFYLGLLWDVTDTDIDNYLDDLLTIWIPGFDQSSKTTNLQLTNALAAARHVCKQRYLVGSSPVLYGLPISCKI